jgi:propanediol dehydratase small subunit
MSFDPRRDYPLGTRRPDLVTTPAGTPLDRVTLEAAQNGTVAHDELRVTADTLNRQADVARAGGRPQLAESLERAAELTALPEDELLEVYTALRPRRSTAGELAEWARRLEERGAPKTAGFVREAAAVYVERGLLRV